MKKIHKKLLGIGGLALVGAITTLAYYMPDAGAVSNVASSTVDVTVNVVGAAPEINISSPLDGAKLTNSNVHIVASYGDADQVTYTLSNGTTSVVIPSPALSGNATGTTGNSGEHDFYYDLKSFDPSKAGYGSYTLKAEVKRGEATVDDTVSFSYSPASIAGGAIETDENNNPIIDVNVLPSVVKVEAIVLKPNGEEAFRTVVDNEGQSPIEMLLPFSNDQSLESDNYIVKFITYSENGLGNIVPDQSEADTNLRTQITYTKKIWDDIPPDDTPAVPVQPTAGDDNNPEVPAPANTVAGETVHVVVTDADGKKVLEIDVPVNENGTVTIPLGEHNIPAGEYDAKITPYATDPSTGEKYLDEPRSVYTHIIYEGKTDENKPTVNKENGNLIVPIANDGTVEKARITIEDSAGNKVVIVVDVEKDQKFVEVPFDKLGMLNGDYKVTVITYSRDKNTGKLVPNQNPAYVNPIEFHYEGKEAEPYQFVDKDNLLGVHTWNRNSNAGTPLQFLIQTYGVAGLFNSENVYFTSAKNYANLFDNANRLNSIYFKYTTDGGLNIKLLSSYLSTLPSGEYYLGVILENGVKSAVKLEVKGDTGSSCTNNPNPVVDINVEEGVEKVEIIVYDKNGKEIFRFESPATSIVTNHITLPFDVYCLSDGEYLIGVIPYARDANGNLVPLISEEEAKKNAMRITYGAPEVPNTGSLFAALNLSSKDFLLSGLIVFMVVTAGGIFILRRQELRR